MRIAIDIPRTLLLTTDQAEVLMNMIMGQEYLHSDSYKDEDGEWKSRQLLRQLDSAQLNVKLMTEDEYSSIKFITASIDEAKKNK